MSASATAIPLRVLIVEDSADDAFLLLRELRKGGYEVDYLRVDDPAAVAEALAAGDWEMVISDYNLPRFSGLNVVELVRDSGRDIPVIVVSGAIGEDLAVEAMHAGASDYIMKDNFARLVPAVQRELREAEVRRERRAAELALKESEERFRELTETIQEVFWMIDCAKSRMIYVSPAFEQVWQQSPQPLYERLSAFLDTVHPEDYERIQTALECDGWAGFDEDYRIQWPDGSERWVHTRSFPIRNTTGDVCRIAGLSVDITERKRLEAERDVLSRALEQTADAVMITNRDGLIEYVNAAFEDMTGYSKEEVLHRQPKMLRSGFQDKNFYAQVWRALSNGLPFTDVFINRRKDDQLYYEEKTLTPVRDAHGDVTHFVSTGRDITRRVKMQQKLQHSSHFDAVTGLANRIMFMDRLSQSVMHARRLKLMIGVLCLGIDLKGLLGRDGDSSLEKKLLPAVAERLREVARSHDTVARVSRDEFAILQRDVSGKAELEELARQIVRSFARPVQADGYELYLTPSIGISIYPRDSRETEQLLNNANVAMRHARKHERIGYRFFSDDMKADARSRAPS